MDLLSHGLVGAATAMSAARRREARLAGVAGFSAALVADVDALFRSSSDPLMVLEWHRHFTHALIFIPAGALVAALLLWPLMRAHVPFQRLYGYAFLGYALAGLLDACTSYGTHLLWPFSDQRTSWSIIAVVDPAFTLLVGVPATVAFVRRVPRAALAALALGALYLTLGVVQHQRALAAAEALAAARGLEPSRIEVKPTLGNLVLWRAMTVADGRIHADAIRVGPTGATRIYPGESAPMVRPADVTAAPAGSRARHDVERFAYFSDELLSRQSRAPDRIGDARFAMLPTSLTPIWSIRVDPAHPDAPVELEVERTMTPALRRCFTDMLLGRDAACRF